MEVVAKGTPRDKLIGFVFNQPAIVAGLGLDPTARKKDQDFLWWDRTVGDCCRYPKLHQPLFLAPGEAVLYRDSYVYDMPQLSFFKTILLSPAYEAPTILSLLQHLADHDASVRTSLSPVRQSASHCARDPLHELVAVAASPSGTSSLLATLSRKCRLSAEGEHIISKRRQAITTEDVIDPTLSDCEDEQATGSNPVLHYAKVCGSPGTTKFYHSSRPMPGARAKRDTESVAICEHTVACLFEPESQFQISEILATSPRPPGRKVGTMHAGHRPCSLRFIFRRAEAAPQCDTMDTIHRAGHRDKTSDRSDIMLLMCASAVADASVMCIFRRPRPLPCGVKRSVDVTRPQARESHYDVLNGSQLHLRDCMVVFEDKDWNVPSKCPRVEPGPSVQVDSAVDAPSSSYTPTWTEDVYNSPTPDLEAALPADADTAETVAAECNSGPSPPEGGHKHSAVPKVNYVYRLHCDDIPSMNSVVDEIVKTRATNTVPADVSGVHQDAVLGEIRSAAVLFIKKGVELQEEMGSTQLRYVRDQEAHGTEVLVDALASRLSWDSFREGLAKWRRSQCKHMPALETILPAADDAFAMDEDAPGEDSEVQMEILGFPLDFSHREREEYGLSTLAVFELKIRTGMAYDQLNAVCRAVQHQAAHIESKCKNVRGNKNNAIAEEEVRRATAVAPLLATRYNNNYDHISALHPTGYDPA
ncbi:hypothetical protein NUW54_g15 [Trametes sanguinea]|nr:hypothetical protein NUW54_g15 [Trametes sanguinea]